MARDGIVPREGCGTHGFINKATGILGSSPLIKCRSFRVRQHRIAPGLLDARRSRIYDPWDSFVARRERPSTLSTGWWTRLLILCQVRSEFFVVLIPCALSHFLWSAWALASVAVLGRPVGLRFGVDILITRDMWLAPANPLVGFTEIWSGCRPGPVLPPLTPTATRLRGLEQGPKRLHR
jgi:hypothetical protein